MEIDETGRDLVLRAMIAMAKADGDVADIETTTISAVFEKVTGETLDEEEIRKAAAGIAGNSAALTQDLKAAANTLDKQTKEAIIKAAYLVLMSDGEIASGERMRLFSMASALKMPEIHITAILEDLER
ncbi:MAG: hypothetical protein Kow0032_14500 [Methyloligellaceae bacterium]